MRQLAAVLIRRKIQKSKQWNALAQDVRQGCVKQSGISWDGDDDGGGDDHDDDDDDVVVLIDAVLKLCVIMTSVELFFILILLTVTHFEDNR